MRMKLKTALLERRIKGYELAASIGKSDTYISRVISGRRDPTAVERRQIADALGMNESELFSTSLPHLVPIPRPDAPAPTPPFKPLGSVFDDLLAQPWRVQPKVNELGFDSIISLNQTTGHMDSIALFPAKTEDAEHRARTACELAALAKNVLPQTLALLRVLRSHFGKQPPASVMGELMRLEVAMQFLTSTAVRRQENTG
jgi:transcriptional regulator with XRE-family HTH domain